MNCFAAFLLAALTHCLAATAVERPDRPPFRYDGPLIGKLTGVSRKELLVRSEFFYVDSLPVRSMVQLTLVYNSSSVNSHQHAMESFYLSWRDSTAVKYIHNLQLHMRNMRQNGHTAYKTLDDMERQLLTASTLRYRYMIDQALSTEQPITSLGIAAYSTYPGTRSCQVGVQEPGKVFRGQTTPKLTKMEKCCIQRINCDSEILHNLKSTDGSLFFPAGQQDHLKRVHCKCDQEFKACLDVLQSADSTALLKLFFDVFELYCWDTAKNGDDNSKHSNSSTTAELVYGIRWRQSTVPDQ